EINLTGYRRYAPKIETTIGEKQNYVECEHIDITPPNITINYPQIFSNTSKLEPFFNFTIIDDYSKLLNYSIYVNGIFNGQKGQALNNSNITLNITGLSEGRHYIIIEAIDKFSNAYNSTKWNITIDITPPNTTITTPVNFTNISSNSFLIEADAIDNLVGVDSVLFFYRNNSQQEWQFLCSDNTIPYRCTWDISLLQDNNTYQLKAYANDTVGNNGLNYTVGNITIDRNGPITLITEPWNYTKLNGSSYLIKVNVTDLLSRVDSIFILYRKNSTENWINLCVDKTYPYECLFNYENLEEGNLYEIRAYSNDSVGNYGLNDTIYNLSINMQGPNITNYNASPLNQKLGLPVQIFANITDKTAVSYAYANIVMPNGTNINLSMADDDLNSIYNTTFYQTYLIGTYNVSIYSNDTFNNINNTETFTFNITYDSLNLYTNKNKYVAGEYVLIYGSGFNAFSNITIYIYNSTNDTLAGFPYDVISNSTGGINLIWVIPIDLELEYYYINATDKQDINRSITTSFEIVSAIIETDKLDYQQGNPVFIFGNYFDENEVVYVNITNPLNELVFEINLTANSTGNINTTWYSDFNETIGNYILSAQQISNPLKKDTYEFTISQRSVYVFTDYPFYKENEIVNVLGYGFSFNPTEYIGTNVSIYIYDQDGISILGYPINLTTNASGNFNYSFIINNLNEGNYTINVTDLNYPNLNNFTKFEVALSTLYTDKTNYINGEIVNIYGSYWTKNTKITIDIKNESGISITGYPKNITSSNLGNISDSLIAQAIGYGITTYKIIAFNPLFNKENATINFTVQRKAILETEKSVYDLNELINISGFFFSQNSPVEILIRYLNNSGFAYYYPKTIISNVNGDITHQFNNTYLCTGSYIIEATDKTFTSLYANTTFNISFINKNSTIKPSYNATASGLYSVFANYGNSYQSDNTYEYFGGIDLNTNFNAFLNYSFNLSSLNTPIEMIHNLSFVLEYCHSGVQTNPLCNQGYPHEGIRNGDQMIAIYNFSNNQWFNLTNLTVNSLSDAENTLIFYLDDLTYNLSNFIQNNILHLQIEMDFNQTGVQDDLLVIDYLAINISYYSYVSRDCKALTTKFFEINNLNKTNKLIPKTNFTIYNSSLNLIDTGNNPYFRYLPEDKLYFEVFSHFVNDNISYFFYNLSFDSSINLTAQINENYNYSLPNFSQTYNGNTIINNVLNITPLISVKDDYISFEKAQLKIPKRGLDINTILHCKNYNYLTSECLEFEVNETDEFEFYEDTNFIYFNVSSFDSFGGGVTASIPNITNISIYNVTGLSDTHTGGILIANSLNTTFNLTQGVYRIQFRIYNAGRRWDIVGNDVVYHSGLNNTWFINTTRDIWYVDSVSTTNRTGGNFTNGKVVWNTSQLGRINAGAVGYFYYVVNITTNKSETYQVYFLINDTSSRSGSYDYSAYKIKDTIPPYIVLNTPLRNDNLSYGNVLFNFSVFDNSDYNLTCNLSINQNNVLNNINSRNKNTTIVYYTLLNSGVYNWSVSCIDIDGNYNVSEKRNFTLISGPEFIDINITETNTSIRLNWSSSLFADSYSIFITTNYSAGFSLIPNVTGITSLEWTDNNAFENEKRYYKVASVKGNAFALSNKTAGKQTLELKPNWNLISIPFNLTEWQIYNGTNGKRIFTDNLCIVSIWRYNSTNQSYEKTDNFNGQFIPSIGSESFTHFENGKGYWFEVDKNCNLTFFGIVPDSNSTYALNNLWNIMGHYSAKDPLLEDESIMKIIDVQPEDSVATIVKYVPTKNDFEVTVHYPGFGWWPSYNNQDFIYLNPMLGYYFDVIQQSNWTHDPNKG
ncbi:MAG: Ig-like domain-containing protein, partial [Candidatus Woesearchaeota archaeon]